MAALEYTTDSYQCVTVDMDSVSGDAVVFKQQLQDMLTKVTEAKCHGIWLTIKKELSHLIPIALEFQFEFHHTKLDRLVLTKWLAEGPSKLPLYATHSMGVGGFVYDKQTNKILLIKENAGPAKGRWKIPGGSVDPNEEVKDAAMREVLEETGIETEFVQLLCFRQSEYLFGCQNLYFVILLKPLTFDIKPQESEIEDACWMDLDDFFKTTSLKGMYLRMMQVGAEAVHGQYSGLITTEIPLVVRKGTGFLYHTVPETKLP